MPVELRPSVAGDLCGAVGGVVVDDKDLKRARLRVLDRESREAGGQVFHSIVGGDDDADLGEGSHREKVAGWVGGRRPASARLWAS